MSNCVHIVCFEGPSPPDYGGAMDIYYKIIALSRLGKQITLHYFHHHKERHAEDLKKYCSAVYTYERHTGISGLSVTQPYIVSSRINRELIDRLNKDNHPILLEGIHCTGVIPYLENKERKIVVRLHNDEERYYHYLFKNESNVFRKLYFFIESRLLAAYQKKLSPSITYTSVSGSDAAAFRLKYGLQHVYFIPCILPWQTVRSQEGKGTYCLYHGNLSVSENEKAVRWLVQHVFSQLEAPFIIAGKGSSRRLASFLRNYKNCTLVQHPSDKELKTLISRAHINVLPSFNQTGVKLKLLHALFEGRFCVTNASGTEGSGLNEGINIADSAAEFIQAIQHLFTIEFTQKDKAERAYLLDVYNNRVNAEKFNELL